MMEVTAFAEHIRKGDPAIAEIDTVAPVGGCLTK